MLGKSTKKTAKRYFGLIISKFTQIIYTKDTSFSAKKWIEILEKTYRKKYHFRQINDCFDIFLT
jgi:hypothetical protein